MKSIFLRAVVILLFCVLCSEWLSSPDQLFASEIVHIQGDKTWGDPNAEIEQMLKITAVSHPAANLNSSNTIPGSENSAMGWWLATYQYFTDNNWEIYSATLNDSQQFRLTTNSAADILPHINNDASRIVFVSTRDGNPEIYVMKSDGTEQLRLTNSPETDTQPSWSFDGSQIVFVSSRNGNPEIYRMNPDGSNQQRLTNAIENDIFPSFSPDERKIIWIRAINSSYGQVWEMNRDGSNQTALTGLLKYAQHPLYAYDGKHIALDYDADNDELNEAVIMNHDGSDQNIVADSYAPPQPQFEDIWVSRWLPNGQNLALTSLTYLYNPYTQVYDLIRFKSNAVCGLQPCMLFGGEYPDAMNLSFANRDQSPPHTTMFPLPTYTRGFQTHLSWQANDTGPSGVESYEAQYRTAADSEWKYFTVGYYWSDHIQNTTSVEFGIDPASLAPGQSKVFFRVRARDNAENVEPWRESETEYASTIFYQHEITGTLTDQRKIPISFEPITIMPQSIGTVTTNLQGSFLGRILSDGEYQVDSRYRVRLNTDSSDTNISLYRRPETNLIQNGGFEEVNMTTAWNTTGTFEKTLDIGSFREGDFLAATGYQCIGYCLESLGTENILFDEYGIGYVLRDSTGGIHLLGPIGEPFMSTFQHYYLAPNGSWQKIAGPNSWDLPFREYHMVMDREDNIHIVWTLFRDNVGPIVDTQYAMLDHASQQWTEPQVLPDGLNPKLLVTSKNELFVVYETIDSSGTVMEIHKSKSESKWSTPTKLIENTPAHAATFAVMADNSLHFLWRANPDNKGEQLFYSSKSLNEAITSQEITGSQTFLSPNLIVTDDHMLHALWKSNNELYYSERMTDTVWTQAERVLGNYDAQLLNDANNNVHLVASNYLYGGGVAKHRMKPPGKPWGKVSDLVGSDYREIYFTAVATDTIYAYMRRGPITVYRLVEPQVISDLAQSMAIPATMHKPTLSFLYQIGNISNGSYFAVEVETNLGSSRVFTQTKSTPWQLGWVDLSRWAGQNITITFNVESPVDANPAQLLLDDIALGPWYTPFPQKASFQHLDFGVGGTIVITGENFIQSPTLFLGETRLAAVQWIDDQTIQAVIPATTPAGVYNLKVVNPGEQIGYLPQVIAIGKQVYLPLIVR